MKTLLLILLMIQSNFIHAHDGGHGPSLKDESLQGGKISAIIKASEVKIGRKAKMLYKAELVHDSRNTKVKLYIYDSNMKPLNLKDFSNTINAIQIEGRKVSKFTLKLDKSGTYFIGERPKNKRVPFNIDIKFSKENQQLFGAFDGLD